MPKIIALSGHGEWMLGKEGYVSLPANTSMKFYTMNMRTLSDAFGGDLDRGIIKGVEPDQEAGPFKTVPNMRLFPPTGLNIRTPTNMGKWHIIKLPQRVPSDNKNLQIQIDPAYPGGADLKTILTHFIEHRHTVVVRRTEFSLRVAREREHILEGLKIAVDNIDEVVRIIRASKNTEEAASNLKERFGLSDKQAEAILAMRLSRLTGLEIEKLEEELAEIRATIEELEALMASRDARMEVIREELVGSAQVGW